eukprot:14974511-Alexandrium_andersonii.AAC.1
MCIRDSSQAPREAELGAGGAPRFARRLRGCARSPGVPICSQLGPGRRDLLGVRSWQTAASH